MARTKKIKIEIDSDENGFISFDIKGYGFTDNNDLLKLVSSVLPVSEEIINKIK